MKKTTVNFFLFSFLALSSVVSFGQSQIKKSELKQFGKSIVPTQGLTPDGHVRCHSTEYEAFLKEQYPKRSTTDEFEAWLAPKIRQIEADRAAGREIQTVYNIPVVVHIVHNGDAIGTGENITDAQVISQINVLNQDYRRLAGSRGGANSTGLAVDTQINFCLAQTDPNGNLTTGIVRHNIAPYSNNVANGTGGPDWETKADVQALKTATSWDPNNYLNMWTIRAGGLSLQSGGLTGLLGYAQFPSDSGLAGLDADGGLASTDGVVASFDAMGTIDENDGTFILNGSYNLGRTMTHEVGHWLGLRHIWGDGNCTVDDFCADTPVAGAANYDCVFVDSCPTSPGADQYQNYMDYSYDYCMDTFTNDQATRIQAVMLNSPRRNTLNASTACQTPTPIIRFTNPTGSINENTNCNFTDFNFPVTLGKVASANAVVTFNVTGGTATQNVDYTIVNPSVTFPTGSTTTQNLTIRVYHDGIVESNETIIVDLILNANGGDAVLNNAAKTMTITIVDNDFAPTATQIVSILEEDFEDATGWTIVDTNADTWGVVTGAEGIGTPPNTIVGKAAYSEKSRTYLNGTGNAVPNNYIVSPQVTIPTGATSVDLTYILAGYGATAGNFSVYFTTTLNPTIAAQITSGTVIQASTTQAAGTSVLKNHDMLPLAGQTGHIAFAHTNNNAAAGLLLVDSVLLKSVSNTLVQTEVNTATAYQASIPTSGTFHPIDATTSKVMASITTDNFNYGCTNVSVSRSVTSAGAPAVNYGANTANNMKVMAKTINVTATNNPSGSNSLKFYFTEAEIAAWESATGNVRSALKVFKGGEAVTYATTLAAFGPNVSLTATTNTGLAGTYYFGTDATLSNQSFDSLSGVLIYPNPTTNELNISLNSDFETATSYTIYNSLGQKILNKKVDSESDLKINTSNYSNGIYFITIERDGDSKTIKFIKN